MIKTAHCAAMVQLEQELEDGQTEEIFEFSASHHRQHHQHRQHRQRRQLITIIIIVLSISAYLWTTPSGLATP